MILRIHKMSAVVIEQFETTLHPHFYFLRQRLQEKKIPFDLITILAESEDPVAIEVPQEYLEAANKEYEDLKQLFLEDPELFERSRQIILDQQPKTNTKALAILFAIPIIAISFIFYFSIQIYQNTSTNTPSIVK